MSLMRLLLTASVIHPPPQFPIFKAPSRYFSIRLDQPFEPLSRLRLHVVDVCEDGPAARNWSWRNLDTVFSNDSIFSVNCMVPYKFQRGIFSGQLKAVLQNFGEAAKLELPFARLLDAEERDLLDYGAELLD